MCQGVSVHSSPSVVKPATGCSIPVPGKVPARTVKSKRLQVTQKTTRADPTEWRRKGVVCSPGHWYDKVRVLTDHRQTKRNTNTCRKRNYSGWLRRSAVNAVTLKKESDVFLKYEAGFRRSEVTSALALGFTVNEVLFSHRHSKLCSGADSVQHKQSTDTKPWCRQWEGFWFVNTFKDFSWKPSMDFFLPSCVYRV